MIIPSSPYTFLTTKPLTRRMSTAHPELLYVLPHQAISSHDLAAVCHYTDGTTSPLVIKAGLSLNASEVKRYRIGYDAVDYDAVQPTKTLKKIVISIADESTGVALGESLTYYPYTPQGDYVQAIYYHNSLGGVDSLICEGDQQVSRQFGGYMTAIPLDAVYDGQAHQYKWVDPTFSTTKGMNTGAMPRGEVEALHDFFSLKRAWEYKVKNGGVILNPIIPEQPEVSFPSSRTNMKKLSFGYRYAFDQRAIDRPV